MWDAGGEGAEDLASSWQATLVGQGAQFHLDLVRLVSVQVPWQGGRLNLVPQMSTVSLPTLRPT